MKILSFNVNGLRSIIKKGFYDFIKSEDPDIIGLQEIKMQENQADIYDLGYKMYWNSAIRKGYSGTLVYTKIEPLSVHYGLQDGSHNDEGRVITLEYDEFYFVTAYVPNSKEGLLRLPYRMEFEDALREYLVKLKEKKHVIYSGDLNVAHNEIDLENPDIHHFDAGFSDEERGKFTELLNAGFIDTFRYFHKDTIKYSWWSYRTFARERNIGWRIDYFLVDKEFIDRVTDSLIYNDIYGSDHCPVGIIIK
ncbi:exodeoxyribonuclease III [bacterium]|nr:exodeoxyribonuclease III [bacterium]